jgi:hypothetical protein
VGPDPLEDLVSTEQRIDRFESSGRRERRGPETAHDLDGR